MQSVIYVDVLFVINVYITWFILKATALISKENPDKIRLFISSVLGGAYSLTVLLPENVQKFIAIMRVSAVVIFIFVAFGCSSLKSFLRLCVSFFACSFVFAGLMFALWFFVSPAGMYFNGAVVYFDISILSLVVLTVVCYGFISLFDCFFKSRAPVNTVFECTVKVEGKSFNLKAFLDTGNRLHDYFTGRPVIVVQRRCLGEIFSEEININEITGRIKIRFLFCDTLEGEGLLPAFSPDEVRIRGADFDFTSENITIALTEKRLLNGEYDAILPMSLFDNISARKDERESEKITVTV